MRKIIKWIPLGILAIAVAALLIWSTTQESPPMTPTGSDAWSRGRVIGETPVRRNVALGATPAGDRFLVWTNMESQLQLTRIGPGGDLLRDQVLPLGSSEASSPQLAVAPDGQMHLLWREGEMEPKVRYVLLASDGTLASEPVTLAGNERGFQDTPQLAPAPGGGAYALWADRIGIEWAILSAEGDVEKEPRILIPHGTSPRFRVDAEGQLHLAWEQDTGINTVAIKYGILDPVEGRLVHNTEVTEILLSDRMELEETAIGLSEDRAYVLWSEYDRGFDRYRFPYAVFPLETFQDGETDLVELHRGEGPLALSTMETQRSPLMASISARMMGAEGRPEQQIVLLTFNPDGGTTEEIVSASSAAALGSTLVSVDGSSIHLAWLETAGFGKYRVIYASTAPEVVSAYNALTPQDAVDVLFSGLFDLSIVIISAIAGLMMWAVLPLVGLVVYHVLTSEESLETPGARLAVVVALIAEVGLAFALPPRFGMETGWQAIRWIAPAVSAALATGLTALLAPRLKENQLFLTFFLFTGVNTVIYTTLYLMI